MVFWFNMYLHIFDIGKFTTEKRFQLISKRMSLLQ